MSKITFSEKGFEDYKYWMNEDRKTLRRINALIEDIERNGNVGIGKPEPLKGNLSDYWSVRIDDKNRIVFRIMNDNLEIIQCGSHYRDK